MGTTNLAVIFFGAILVNNFTLNRFLGICSFIGVSKQTETAVGMSMAVTFVMALASAVASLIWDLILVPMHMEYMETLVFILVIAVLVQIVEMFVKKMSPALYQALGVYLPLITTNCAVLGVALLNVSLKYGFVASVVHGVGAALGYSLAIIIFSGMRERMATAPIPKALDGFPIALIAAGIFSVAFLGFQGLF
jgi:electron transport complex protein RnfA